MKWLLLWLLIVMIMTLIADLLYVFWPYPNGPRGVDALRANRDTEWAMLLSMANESFAAAAYRLYDWLYQAFFIWPGIDSLLADARNPTTATGLNDLARKFVYSTIEFWHACIVGLQIFAGRLAVIALSLPLICLAALGAISDGLLTWYLRRTGGRRESGFIYHRAKRLVGMGFVALLVIYLVPPVPVDPRWVIPPFVIFFAASLRVAVGYFKKYL